MIRASLPRPMLALHGLFLAALVWAAAPSAGRADSSPEEAGLKIATEARERQKGFGNFTASLAMVLRNKRGQESRREIRLKVIEVEDDGDRTMFVFDRPRNVKGTAFLVHAHKTESDEQWLYLPALKRVKRISSSKSVRLLHGQRILLRGHGRHRGREVYTTGSCATSRAAIWNAPFPSAFRSAGIRGYSRQLVWLDRDELRTMQIQYFDRRDAHLKTMVVEDYAKYLDRLLAGQQVDDDEPSHGKEHRAALVGLQVRDRPRPRRLHPDRAETGTVESRQGPAALAPRAFPRLFQTGSLFAATRNFSFLLGAAVGNGLMPSV